MAKKHLAQQIGLLQERYSEVEDLYEYVAELLEVSMISSEVYSTFMQKKQKLDTLLYNYSAIYELAFNHKFFRKGLLQTKDILNKYQKIFDEANKDETKTVDYITNLTNVIKKQSSILELYLEVEEVKNTPVNKKKYKKYLERLRRSKKVILNYDFNKLDLLIKDLKDFINEEFVGEEDAE